MPADGTANLVHVGRRKGAQGKYKRALRHALMLAAEASRNSKTGDLFGYCLFLADERPELFVPMLGKLLPREAKVQVHPGHHNLNIINANMPLEEMVSTFAARIQSGYIPASLEHEDNPEDEEDPDHQ